MTGNLIHISDDLLNMHIRFVIRLKGDRFLVFQDGEAIVKERIANMNLRYSTVIPVKRPKLDGRTHWKLLYDYFPVTLPGRVDDQLYFVVGHRERRVNPIYLLVNIPISCPRDALRWIKGYFSRWGMEGTFRFWKQKSGLEDIRTIDIGNFKKLLWIAVVAFAFMTACRRGRFDLTYLNRSAKLNLTGLGVKQPVVSSAETRLHL